MKAELFYPSQDITGEGATWIDNKNSLLWVNIEACELHRYQMLTQQITTVNLGRMASTIIPWTGNRVVVALQGRLVSYDLETGVIGPLVEIVPGLSDVRPNDGKASPDGRMFIGVMNMRNHKETGALYRVDPDFSLHKVLDHQYIPNGIVWSADGERMYYNDTGRHVIEQYRYDKASGAIHFERVAVSIGPGVGGPDGMTIDADDNLWVAQWGGSGVYVYDPDTSKLIDKVEVPVPNVASCSFGREGQLFITTARAGLSAERLKKYPLSGSVFTVHTSYKGARNNYSFKGMIASL